MNKILLVYEDYVELMDVESTLKKVGFDVIGLTSEYAVAEQILAFNPDLVIASGKGPKVSALGVGRRLKDMSRWQGKLVLVFPQNVKPDPQELLKIRMDLILEAPLAALRAVQVAAKILNLDESTLVSRVDKNQASDSKVKFSISSGGKGLNDQEPIYVTGRVDENAPVGSATDEGADFKVDLSAENKHEGSSTRTEDQKTKLDFRFGDRVQESTIVKEPKSTEIDESGFASADIETLTEELFGKAPIETGDSKVEELAANELNKIDLNAEKNEITELTPTALDSVLGVNSPEQQEASASESDLEGVFTEKSAVAEELARAERQGVLDSSGGNLEQWDAAQINLEELAQKAQQELQRASEKMSLKAQKYSEFTDSELPNKKSSVTRVQAKQRQNRLKNDWDKDSLDEQDVLRRQFTRAMFKK